MKAAMQNCLKHLTNWRIVMTDQLHFITPPQDQVYKWWEEACKRPPSSFFEKLDHVAVRAAAWGWQQRDASVPGELQEARDEELEECCEWLRQFKPEGYVLAARLRTHRRFKPKSRKQRALDALAQMESQLDTELTTEIRNALEELPDA
jgi:hypothetical protein